jgi:hypothetical protein
MLVENLQHPKERNYVFLVLELLFGIDFHRTYLKLIVEDLVCRSLEFLDSYPKL